MIFFEYTVFHQLFWQRMLTNRAFADIWIHNPEIFGPPTQWREPTHVKSMYEINLLHIFVLGLEGPTGPKGCYWGRVEWERRTCCAQDGRQETPGLALKISSR